MMRPWALALPAMLMAAPSLAATPALRPARAFGYFPGALVSASTEFWLPPGTGLDPASLPVPGPVDPETDLRRIIWRATPMRGGTLVTLRLSYQIFYSPQETGLATIPGFTLTLRRDGRTMAEAIQGFGVQVSPFRHDLTPTLDPNQMRPDPAPLAVTSGRPWRMPVAGALITGFSALLLLVAQRADRGGSRAFAGAYRTIRRQRLSDHAARLALHRAFDATAGQRILAQDIEAFLARHRQFSGLGSEIREFFAQSNQIFFATEPGTAAARPALRAFARALTRAERRLA